MYSKARLDHIVDLIKLMARAWTKKKKKNHPYGLSYLAHPYGLSYLAQRDHFLGH